ncbi:hypothetical protein F5B22DRAFT_262331 [Xylaria bambusicola]|uniref:uncharacterized protein n=1 Tax=Xylaria bambusicola TaxID=326684 RepID=UPI002007FB3A|nr:uncharacterized protein F5B22DRAFT_262331 [Xylaria bambusicola]KAI0525971.1 hypothetical protein F5B22DRAFT_262331 [Xylaria bambusicola]
MSASRAVRPFLGVSSRLIVDQFLPRSAATTGMPWKKLFCRAASSSTPTRAPITVCWSCRHDYASRRQQLRFSSSSPQPPSHDRESESKPQNPPSSAPPPHYSATTGDNNTQDIPIDQPKIEKEQDRPSSQPPPSMQDPDLPSAQQSRRSALNQSLTSFMDRAQTTLFVASQRINDLTGYSSIETLKSQISDLEEQLRAAQSHLTATRSAYKSAVSDRAATQREVTTLLARQKTWTPADFERFTTLYRQDYELEASVGSWATELEQAEREAERLNRELGAGILARYHEEQIWSDKIRRMSTWGTWGLMGVNILLFLLLQFGAEPWRRKRLVRGFEEKVREALAEQRVAREEGERKVGAPVATMTAPSIEDVEAETTRTEEAEEPVVIAAPDVAVPEPEIIPLSPTSTTPAPSPESLSENILPRISWRESFADLGFWRSFADDLVSDRKVALRMKDISLIAVEGVATGIVVAGTVALFLIRWT